MVMSECGTALRFTLTKQLAVGEAPRLATGTSASTANISPPSVVSPSALSISRGEKIGSSAVTPDAQN